MTAEEFYIQKFHRTPYEASVHGDYVDAELVVKMMDEYSRQQVEEKDKELKELREAVCEFINKDWNISKPILNVQNLRRLSFGERINIMFNEETHKWQLKGGAE